MSIQNINPDLVLVEDDPVANARAACEQIRIHINKAQGLIVELWRSRAWLLLDYESWDDLCAKEFGTRIAMDSAERNEMILELRREGMSMPAIASATGASVGTVHNNLSELKGSDDPPQITGLDGKKRKASQKKTTKPKAVEKEPDPEPPLPVEVEVTAEESIDETPPELGLAPIENESVDYVVDDLLSALELIRDFFGSGGVLPAEDMPLIRRVDEVLLRPIRSHTQLGHELQNHIKDKRIVAGKTIPADVFDALHIWTTPTYLLGVPVLSDVDLLNKVKEILDRGEKAKLRKGDVTTLTSVCDQLAPGMVEELA